MLGVGLNRPRALINQNPTSNPDTIQVAQSLTEEHSMQSRRNFIGKVASSLAGSLAVSNVLGANDRIRLGIIGAGDRGMQIAREAMACPNAEVVAFADIY